MCVDAPGSLRCARDDKQAGTLQSFAPLDDALLQHLSPLSWEHLSLAGDYLCRSLPLPQTARRRASSTSTATGRDTPGSGMVTPIRCWAISMVMRLWVMNMNWVSADIFCTMAQ